VFSCLFAQVVILPASSTAAETAKTVRLDGKILYIPEVKLTRETNPVDKFLYIGSWETKAGKNQNSLCAIDSKNNVISIKSPGTLLENSKPRVVTQNNVDVFFDGISWGQRQATHIAFRITSDRQQPVMIEIANDSEAALFLNGKFTCHARAGDDQSSGGRSYLPVTLERGKNIINIKQYSMVEKPRIEMAVSLNASHDLAVAWQARGGLLKKLLYLPSELDDMPALAWGPHLGNLSPSLEVRDVATNKIVFQKESVRQGRIFGDDTQNLAPGIYEATYRTANESNSEFFMVGNPDALFAEIQHTLSLYSPDAESKHDIDAQLERAKILLSKDNYKAFDRAWQEKAAYTFSRLADFARQLKEGGVDIVKGAQGLHIRDFVSGADGSTQYYRLYVPTTYKPGNHLPLLVIPSARIADKAWSFIEGPIIANQREALRWAKFAEQHGVALLWPGYRAIPEGYSYESMRIDEAIKAVEKDYDIDGHRISIYATCGAGYNAGRLVEEYSNRFAAIVYDRAVFDLSLYTIRTSPSLMEWYTTVNPSRHVLENRNIKIFVMHDNTSPPGHGPMELTTAFLERAKKTRDDVVSYLSERPMTMAERMDKVFTWLAPCRNENPDDRRSHFLAKAGYTGPIMEIFTTPLLVVEGTHASEDGLQGIQSTVESIKKGYVDYFHGAECPSKKDTDVTQRDIETHSLILVGDPKSNSVWEKLQPQLPVKVTTSAVFYNNDKLTGAQPFQAIVRHPVADDKFILMIGAGDLRTLDSVKTDELFNAWYDCITTAPRAIISKLDDMNNKSRPINSTTNKH